MAHYLLHLSVSFSPSCALVIYLSFRTGGHGVRSNRGLRVGRYALRLAGRRQQERPAQRGGAFALANTSTTTEGRQGRRASRRVVHYTVRGLVVVGGTLFPLSFRRLRLFCSMSRKIVASRCYPPVLRGQTRRLGSFNATSLWLGAKMRSCFLFLAHFSSSAYASLSFCTVRF